MMNVRSVRGEEGTPDRTILNAFLATEGATPYLDLDPTDCIAHFALH